MLWFYDSIIDWMIANPGRPLSECAAYVQRTTKTLSIIVNSDMFKAALARRREQFRTFHDVALIEKTTKVAHASLDALLGALEKKKDTVPLDTLREISDSALTRLGYGVESRPQSGVSVFVGNGAQANVFVPVSSQDLQEARMALRQVQETQARRLPPPQMIEHEAVPLDPLDALLLESKGAEPVDEAKEVVEHASPTDSA